MRWEPGESHRRPAVAVSAEAATRSTVRRPCSAAALLLITTAVASPSDGRAEPGIDLRRFQPPVAPEATLYLEPTSTPGGGEWNVGAWGSYAYRPITLRDSRGELLASVIEHQFAVDYVASLGIGKHLALGLRIPTVAWQEGDELGQFDSLNVDAPVSAAIGDVALITKGTLLETGGLGGFGLAGIAEVTAPTGNEQSYVSDDVVTAQLRALAEFSLIALDARVTAGIRIRGEEKDFANETFGHDLPWAAGLSFRPQLLGLDDAGRWTWSSEFRGAIAVTPSFAAGPSSPALFGASARYRISDMSFLAGAELPLNDAVGNPAVRAVFSVGWAPRFYDIDGDGIEDDRDECPELPEDRDDFEDSDGCPDFDNDDDGVPDDEDECPKELEDEDGFADDDGCTDPDNDGDSIPDDQDACPDTPGPKEPEPKYSGCPATDNDGDGVDDRKDKCLKHKEDRDGYRDDDGCPDVDNDRDGIRDPQDACPDEPGQRFANPKLNGCPNPDSDGDTYDDDDDRCPDQPEDFDGQLDEDGCPDDDSAKPEAQRAKPLIKLVKREADWQLTPRDAIRFETAEDGVRIDDDALPTLRAIARALNEHPDLVALIGVRAENATAQAEQLALTKAFAIVRQLQALTRRPAAAETVAFSAVSDQPRAQATGVGFMLVPSGR